MSDSETAKLEQVVPEAEVSDTAADDNTASQKSADDVVADSSASSEISVEPPSELEQKIIKQVEVSKTIFWSLMF